MAIERGFDSMFNPKTVAVIGVSRESGTKKERYARGAGFVGFLQKVGFSGRIYPIGPEAKDVFGLKAYPSVASVPETIDLAIITVSAPNVPAALGDCALAGIKNVHVFSSGFSETGEETGKELEERIKKIAQESGMRLVGPNCMGLHLPKGNLSLLSFASLEKSGPVAYLSQSGGHAISFVGNAPAYGIYFSKVVSFGNAAVLDCTDYLEYFTTDSETKLIALYVEGVKDGGRFFRVAREINREKPVIIWKGGQTGPGAEAAASHTGSLAGKEAIWEAFFKQSGVVGVNSVQELLDVTMTFLYLSPLRGRRAGFAIAGGGQSVAAADAFARAGLNIPLLCEEAREKLRSFIPPVNTSTKNPVDLGLGVSDITVYQRTLEVMMSEPYIDFIVVDPNLEMIYDIDPEHAGRLIEFLCQFVKDNPYKKPLVAILEAWEGNLGSLGSRERLQQDLIRAGIVTYRSLSRACRALAKFVDYHEFHQVSIDA